LILVKGKKNSQSRFPAWWRGGKEDRELMLRLGELIFALVRTGTNQGKVWKKKEKKGKDLMLKVIRGSGDGKFYSEALQDVFREEGDKKDRRIHGRRKRGGF